MIRHFKLWLMILIIYIMILIGIGQIAFTKQYFNEAESMVGEFLNIKEKYQIDEADTSTTELIDNLIESSADSSSDLQELASQSFNIVLGAMLAFLSASATIVFQSQADNKPDEEDTPGILPEPSPDVSDELPSGGSTADSDQERLQVPSVSADALDNSAGQNNQSDEPPALTDKGHV